MEKQIRKIMDDELMGDSDDSETCAKEIASLFGEFIEWFTSENSPVAIIYGGNPERFATSQDDYTIDELFNYWFENIKTK